MLRRIRLLLETIRFSHTLFALPFAVLAALMAAAGDPDRGIAPREWRWPDAAGILLCMAFARSTAMAFNRLADRHLDAHNPRTKMRHLPAGLLSASAVAAFAVACGAGFIASTALFLPNRWPLCLAAPVLVFLCGYSYAKRFTALAHFWLGAALMLAPLCAWIALRGELAWAPIVLGAGVLFWVAGFDVIYACQDAAVDVALGLRSVPARLGVGRALRVAAGCHLAMVALLAALPLVFPPLGAIFWLGVAGTAALLVYEHRLVRPDDLSRVNVAFFNVNVIVSMGLAIAGALDLYA